MIGAKTVQSQCVSYELEIEINAPIERVWEALIDDTNQWWLPDFHMVDPESSVEFDVSPGGNGLVEYKVGGGFLIWYDVQYFLPEQHTVYLVGNMAPDFGGPSTNHLKLSLLEMGNNCKLQVSDSHVGNVDESVIQSLGSGWTSLFTDGLKTYVETK